MRVSLLTLVMAVLAIDIQAAEPLALDFEGLGLYVTERNKAFEASHDRILAANARLGNVGRSFYPKTTLALGYAEESEASGVTEQSPFWRFELESNLFRSGRDQLAQEQRQATLSSRHWESKALYRRELFKAQTYYIQLLSKKHGQNLASDCLKAYEGLFRSLQKKIRAGLKTSTGLLNIELAMDELKTDLLELQHDEHELEDKLQLALGLEHGIELRLKPLNDLGEPKLVKIESKLGEQPELKKLAVEVSAARFQADARYLKWLPDLSFFANYTAYSSVALESSNLPQRDLNLGLRLSLALDEKVQEGSEWQARGAEADALEAQQLYLKGEFAHRFHEYQRQLKTAVDLSGRYQVGIQKAEKMLRQMQNEFDRGLVESSELQAALHAAYLLQRRLLAAQVEANTARVGLETLATPDHAG